MEERMKYAVLTKFYNDGRVSKGGPVPVPDGTKPSNRETPAYDVYVDIFDTLQEARRFQGQKA
jgi:hypothetical protein